LLVGFLHCLACKDIVDHTKITRVSTHIKGKAHLENLAKHKKKNEDAKRVERVQISLLTAMNNAEQTAKVKAGPVVLDPQLEAFRTRVIGECLKAGIDAEKIAQISELLSAATRKIPSSSSGVRDYIPPILEREQREVSAQLKDVYFFSVRFQLWSRI
jgi:hypothetical protein